MKRFKSFLLLIIIIIANVNICVYAENKFNDGVLLFVSPTGNDNNDGTSEKTALKTVAKAQAKAKLYKNLGSEQVTIYFRSGTYEPFTIEGSAQSGTKDCRIVYENYPGEKAVFSQGVYLDGKSFSDITDSNVLKNLDEDVKDKIKQYDLSGKNIVGIENNIVFGTNTSIGSMLYVNDKKMNIARWPDSGYVYPSEIGKMIDGRTVQISDRDLADRFNNEENMWIGGYFSAGWAYETEKIGSINNDLISLNRDMILDTSRVYLFNSLKLLDTPGEWYIDTKSKMLYYYPVNDLENSRIMFAAGKKNIISIKGVSYVTLKGLDIEGTQGCGIEVVNSENIEITECNIKNITTNGINLNEVFESKISDNKIFNVGCSGVTLSQFTKRYDLIDGNVEISDNEIYNFSQFVRTYTPAIALSGVGNVVKGNSLHDAPHNAIMFALNNNVIEYNDIYRVLSETDDAGAIYAGRSWVQMGNVIRYNKIHDCSTYEGGGIIGIYLDDMFSGTHVYGNVIDGFYTGILMGGGHFNIIENNVICNTKNQKNVEYAIYTDSRGAQSWFSSFFEFPDKKLLSNCQFIKELLQVEYLVNPAYEQYPELRKILEKNYREPQGNILRNNISYCNERFRIETRVRKNGVIENNLEFDENPGFNDAQNYDFTGADIPGFEGINLK